MPPAPVQDKARIAHRCGPAVQRLNTTFASCSQESILSSSKSLVPVTIMLEVQKLNLGP